ncbi:hypothetical protein V8C37DRAFT_365620 [Trichoderma ceciliae]
MPGGIFRLTRDFLLTAALVCQRITSAVLVWQINPSYLVNTVIPTTSVGTHTSQRRFRLQTHRHPPRICKAW